MIDRVLPASTGVRIGDAQTTLVGVVPVIPCPPPDAVITDVPDSRLATPEATRKPTGQQRRISRQWSRGAPTSRVRGIVELSSLVAGLAIWQGVSVSQPHLLPGLQHIASAARQEAGSGELWSQIGVTMRDLGVGLAISLVVGIALGVATGMSAAVAKAANMYLGWMLAVPEVAMIPFFVAALGYGYTTRITVVIVFSLPVIVQRVLLGVRRVPRPLADMARSFEVSRAQYIRKVMLPAALPSTMVGIRLGFSRAMLGIVAYGILIQLFGLGGRVYFYQQNFEFPQMFLYLLVIIVISLFITRLIQRIDRIVTHWNKDAGLA